MLSATERQPLARLIRAESLLVAVDFDGTLAPLVDDPSQARAPAEATDALERLAVLPYTRVAVVSGRSLEDLLLVAPNLSQAIFVGSHGAEFMTVHATGSMRYSPDVAQQERILLNELLAVAGPLVAAVNGAWIEHKALGIAVHSRLSTPEAAGQLHVDLSDALAERNLHPYRRAGHDVVEYSVSSLTKGDAMRRLKELTGADKTLFIGDDRTDEDALARLQPNDVGVKCGAGETIAPFQVPSPRVVARLLAHLATQRELWQQTS